MLCSQIDVHVLDWQTSDVAVSYLWCYIGSFTLLGGRGVVVYDLRSGGLILGRRHHEWVVPLRMFHLAIAKGRRFLSPVELLSNLCLCPRHRCLQWALSDIFPYLLHVQGY